MRELPTGADLLATARQILREDLLPLLPAKAHFQALMIANAMGIAARELEAGDAPEGAELERLVGLLGAGADPGGERQDRLIALNRDLARRIREGRYDPGAPKHDSVRDHLWEVTRERVRVSNPKALP